MAGNRQLLLTRLSDRLHALFDNSISLADVAQKQAKEQENFFLTRSLAALALMDDAGLLPDQAAKCVTDVSADDGMDAIHIDEKRRSSTSSRANGGLVQRASSSSISRDFGTA